MLLWRYGLRTSWLVRLRISVPSVHYVFIVNSTHKMCTNMLDGKLLTLQGVYRFGDIASLPGRRSIELSSLGLLGLLLFEVSCSVNQSGSSI